MLRVPSLLLFFTTAWFPFFGVAQEPFPRVKSVDRQPLLAQVQRVKKAMSFLGVPLDERTVSELDGLKKGHSDKARKARFGRMSAAYGGGKFVRIRVVLINVAHRSIHPLGTERHHGNCSGC